MKIEELVVASPALQRLAMQKMPAKVAYAIAKNIKAANAELSVFDETRVKLLQENWSYNEKTEKYDIPPEDQERWDKMYRELLDQEVDVKVYKVNLSTMDGVELTPAEFLILSWMFTDEE